MSNQEAGVVETKTRGNCIDCELRQTMLCSDVSTKELAFFHTWIDSFTAQPGEVLYNVEAPADGFYCIRSGTLKLVKYSMSGAARIVRVLKAGDVAGLEAVFSDKFAHTAVAIGEVRICRIPIGNFRSMIQENSGLQRRLLEKSQAALQEVETWLSELAGGIGAAPAKERMARLLLYLREGESDRINRFNIDDIGAMLGISMETVSRILSDLARQGLIEKCGTGKADRHFRADIAGLERLAAGEDAAP